MDLRVNWSYFLKTLRKVKKNMKKRVNSSVSIKIVYICFCKLETEKLLFPELFILLFPCLFSV
jgi:hypothetical protein